MRLWRVTFPLPSGRTYAWHTRFTDAEYEVRQYRLPVGSYSTPPKIERVTIDTTNRTTLAHWLNLNCRDMS